MPRPHVPLLCVDDFNPSRDCSGDKPAIPPNFDRLAARGLRFTKPPRLSNPGSFSPKAETGEQPKQGRPKGGRRSIKSPFAQ